MNVSDAVASRKSVRAFTDKKVDTSLILSLLEKAARAPSGGNLQPWRIFVINDASSRRFQQFLASKTEQEDPAYDVYQHNYLSPIVVHVLKLARICMRSSVFPEKTVVDGFGG